MLMAGQPLFSFLQGVAAAPHVPRFERVCTRVRGHQMASAEKCRPSQLCGPTRPLRSTCHDADANRTYQGYPLENPAQQVPTQHTRTAHTQTHVERPCRQCTHNKHHSRRETSLTTHTHKHNAHTTHTSRTRFACSGKLGQQGGVESIDGLVEGMRELGVVSGRGGLVRGRGGRGGSGRGGGGDGRGERRGSGGAQGGKASKRDFDRHSGECHTECRTWSAQCPAYVPRACVPVPLLLRLRWARSAKFMCLAFPAPPYCWARPSLQKVHIPSFLSL
jgi:hypothetical protein